MTPQEAFDLAATGLLRQGRKSMSKRGPNAVCAYRGEDGCKCGIGFLIPDNEYNSTLMEGQRVLAFITSTSTVFSIAENLGASKEYLGADAINFFCELQAIHDTKPVDKWRSLLTNFATKHNLSPSILETVP